MDIETRASSQRCVAEGRPTCAGLGAAGRRDGYWFYAVTDCGLAPVLQQPIKDPARFPWHEVKKVDHYCLSVDALTQPIQVREQSPPYGDPR